MIPNSKPCYPTLTYISNTVSLDTNTLTRFTKILRPNDYKTHFNIMGDRNVCKTEEVKRKISETFQSKRNIRIEIIQFIKNNFYNNKRFWTKEQLNKGYIGDWTKDQYQKILADTLKSYEHIIKGSVLLKTYKSNRISNKEAILTFARVIPMIMDEIKFYLSLNHIRNLTSLDSTLIGNIAINLRPNDYQDRYPIGSRVMTEIRSSGYPPEFFDENFRRQKRLFQTVIINGNKLIHNPSGVFRDLWTGEPITNEDKSIFHHINYNKLDSSFDNLCFILDKNHGIIWGKMNSFEAEKFLEEIKLLLQNNINDLKKGIVPNSWKDYLQIDGNNQYNLTKWTK